MEAKTKMGRKQKFIFVTGGVLSGVGKGITAASLGAVLQSKGVKVSIQKCDPYLNVDAGLLNPAEHGECYVTRDGAETDLDLGHYERFLDIELEQKNITLSGKLLLELISDERNGKFGGKTVQLIPHLTRSIQNAIKRAADGSDVHIVEIGGTVGDYEGLSFLEAIRELAQEVGRANCLFVHVVYVPFLGTSKEFKTKPAQNALNDLRGFGIVPDSVMIRTETYDKAPLDIVRKISLFGGVPEENTLLLPNVDTVYRVPLTLANSNIAKLLAKFTGNRKKPYLPHFQEIIKNQTAKHAHKLTIGLVAKYMDNEDTYISVLESLKAAAWVEDVDLTVKWIEAEKYEAAELEKVDAIVVPGGFGTRGVEGKIKAARFALDNKVPYLGLCLGLQVAVVAAARKSGLNTATSGELSPNSKTQVIYIMEGQEGKQSTGGTMRLGDYKAVLTKGSKVARAYGKITTTERHRHRYEVNQKYLKDIAKGGIVVSGTSPDGKLVEYIESVDDNYFVATQAHPEFRSRPFKPHPLFVGLIKAAKNKTT